MREWLGRYAPSGDALRVVAFFAPLFAAAGVGMPFAPIWFESRGLTPAEIGTMMGVGMWIRFGGHLAIGEIADRLGERRRVLIALGLVALAMNIAYIPVQGLWQVVPIYLIATLAISPMFSLGENLALLTVRGRGLDYGRVRLWGSVSFMAVSLGAGAILVGRSADWVLGMLILAYGLTAVGAYLLPDVRTERSERRKGGALYLLRLPAFWIFLLASGAVQTSHGAYYAFSTLHWRQSGLAESTIGLLWAIGIVAEILLFAVATRATERFSPAFLIGLGGVAGILRWSLTAATVDPAALFVLQTLHALTFCAAHLGAMQFIVRAVPEGLSASAQSVHSAFAIGALMGVSMTLAGWVFATLGGAAAFAAMAGFSAVGVGAAALLARRWDGERLAL
jgi:PPP family 3-phenylpropionic acid transporter